MSITHKKYERYVENENTEILTITDQKRIIEKETLKNPAKSCPTSLHQILFEKLQGRLGEIMPINEISSFMAQLKRTIFLPKKDIEAFKLSQTSTNQTLCPKVDHF